MLSSNRNNYFFWMIFDQWVRSSWSIFHEHQFGSKCIIISCLTIFRLNCAIFLKIGLLVSIFFLFLKSKANCTNIELNFRLNLCFFFFYHCYIYKSKRKNKSLFSFWKNIIKMKTENGQKIIFFYVIVPNTGLWRQIEGPYSSYCAFVWHTW